MPFAHDYLLPIGIYLAILLAGGMPMYFTRLRREFGMFVALASICLVLFLSNPGFLSPGNIVAVTRQIAMLGIFTVGSSFVIVAGGIDLSVGSLIGLTGVLIAKFSLVEADAFGWPIWVGIALAVGIALLIGLLQGLLITRLRLQPFIVTLGVMLLLRGVSQTVCHGGSFSFGDLPFRNLAYGTVNIAGVELIPYPVLIYLPVLAVGAYLLHGTVFGRYVYAVGGNREAAEYSGVPVRRVETLTYVISAGTAALAGICYAAYNGEVSQQLGIAYELTAIAAAVLGGCSLSGGQGSIVGIFIGSAILPVILNGINMFRIIYHLPGGRRFEWRPDSNWQNIIIGAVILLAVVLDQLAQMFQNRRRIRRTGEVHKDVQEAQKAGA